MEVGKCALQEAVYVEKGKNIVEVAKKLKKEKVRHLLVVDKGKPVGVVGAVDIINNIVAEGKDPKKAKAESIMNTPVLMCNASDHVVRAYFYMLEKNIFSLPVVEKGKVRGMLTMQEALKHIKEAKEKSGD